jgi:DnaJ like chaperone protein
MARPSGLIRCTVIVTTPPARVVAQKASLEGWYGKIIGAILGYLVGRGLLGAIVGFVIGHQFDRVASRNRRGALGGGGPGTTGAGPHGSPAEMRQAFFEATFHVMGHVAKSDGRVSEREIDAARTAMNRFALSEAERRRAIELFTAGKNPDFPLEATLERLRWLMGDQSNLARLFVQIQLEAAMDGDGLGDRTRAVFMRMCRALGISPFEFASLEAMVRLHRSGWQRQSGGGQQGAGGGATAASRLADAYDALGLKATASDAEVRRAYRRLVSKNHPDKLVAQGLPESMIAAAHERTQRILEAYETIKNHRGLK